MKFRFCGDAECPDWVLAEINTLSRLSSVKLKQLALIVVHGIVEPPIDLQKAERLISESKLDPDVDLKACVACLTFIITSTARFGCDHTALHSELQQLGLPREHSTSIKRVTDDHNAKLAAIFAETSLRVNGLEGATAEVAAERMVRLELVVNGEGKRVTLTPNMAEKLVESLKEVRSTMVEISK